MAKKVLEVGQRVWIEARVWIYRDGKDDVSIKECEVVRANNSSAYLVYVEDMGKEKLIEVRVKQSNLEVMNMFFGTSYRIWLALEDREIHEAYVREVKELRASLHKRVDGMNLEELREFAG